MPYLQHDYMNKISIHTGMKRTKLWDDNGLLARVEVPGRSFSVEEPRGNLTCDHYLFEERNSIMCKYKREATLHTARFPNAHVFDRTSLIRSKTVLRVAKLLDPMLIRKESELSTRSDVLVYSSKSKANIRSASTTLPSDANSNMKSGL